MKVSFVIPSRNQARFICKCIDSCLGQEIGAREVLVMDGASDDGTRELLKSYGDRISWRSQPDAGQSDAVNQGVRLARGEILAWINSDDYYPHTRVLPRVLQEFDADSELDVVYGDGLMVDDKARPIRIYRSRPIESAHQILLRPSSFVLQPAVFLRRSLFLDVGGLDERLNWTMDYDLWLRLFPQARRVRYLPEVLAHATYHADAKSVRTMLQQIREVTQLKRRYARALALGRGDRLRMLAGVGTLYAYWAAVRLGLKRTS